ncbi:MAG: chromosome segregation protein [Flavobacteriaceae bacterium]|nr:MAG: chromosome segregation protein [Flavobacteriaceae bacterium]
MTEVEENAVEESKTATPTKVEAAEEVSEINEEPKGEEEIDATTKTKESTKIENKEEGASEATEPVVVKIEEAVTEVNENTAEESKSAAPTKVEAMEEVSEINDKPKGEEEIDTSTKSEENTKEEGTDEAVIEEIEESNAEDAEDSDNHQRHQIPILDYHSLSMENLVGELQRLIRNEKVQAIKKHIDGIKYEFDLKFQDFLDHKKEEFIAGGGNEIDFRYNSVTKRQFNEVYSDYRDKRNQYYKSLEQNLKTNLTKRLEIIEELKGLVNIEEDINTTYKNFKNIQESWRNAGPIPRTHYNNVWRTYHHHIEIFYDFLHLNRELRDLDFKHNLEEKLKIVERAEALVQIEDLGKAFQELQTLHKIWKEDIGPVGKEHREEIWDRFSNATKAMHQRRQEFYKDLDKSYEVNLVKKHEIIAAINDIASNVSTNHKALQQQIKNVEALRDDFFKAGKVPQKVNEKTWASFKEAVRAFNRNKNNYYKNLKKDQQENLDKKRALLQLATSLKDSEEWDTATSEMKRIQSEWKKIGHVPRKFSDKIWHEFKNTCNHYFDRLHSQKNSAYKVEQDNFEKKSACMDKLKAFQLGDNRDENLTTIKQFISEWKTFGRVPYNKRNIDGKFNKILDAIFKKLDVSRQESELLKYGNKIQSLAKADNQRAISNERVFIRRKMEESKNEIRQLENNMQFFSSASEDNPLVRDVLKNLNNHKEAFETWKAKLKKLNIMENNLNKELEEQEGEEAVSSEEE